MATKARSRQAIENHLEAMKHPLRHRCFEVLHTRVASPKEISDELGEPLTHVAHHVKRLVKLGCAEEVDQRQVRGAVEHFYKATEQVLVDTEDWDRLCAEDVTFAKHLRGTFMQSQLDEFTASAKAGIFEEDDRWHITRNPIVVDAQGQEEALELGRRVQAELAEIVQRSTARQSDESIPMAACISIFRTVRSATL